MGFLGLKFCRYLTCAGEAIDPATILSIPCDVLVPAAIGNVINSDTAESIDAKYVVEAANGPTTPEGDAILRKRGITVLPDIYTNGGKSLWRRLAVSPVLWLQASAGVSMCWILHSNTTGARGGCCARKIGVTHCQASPVKADKSCMYLYSDQETFPSAGHTVQCPTLCAGLAETLQYPQSASCPHASSVVCLLVYTGLAYAGGVTVSFFEWVQNLQNFKWEEDEVNKRLDRY